MSVDFYISNFAGGGAEINFINLVNLMNLSGYNSQFIVNKSDGPNISSLDDSIKINNLEVENSRGAIYSLVKYINQSKPDIIISTLTHCNLALLIASLFTKHSTKIIVREANSFLDQRKSLNLWRLFYERIRAGILYRFADEIIVNSEGARTQLANAIFIDHAKIKILPNLINYEKILSLSKKKIDSKLKNLIANKRLIVSVGRLIRNKDYFTMLRAIKDLNRENIILLIMGEGKQYDIINKEIIKLKLQEKVELMGYVENPYNIMKIADVFLLTSIFEGMPNVLIEALSLKVPIVSSNCNSGPRELINNGENGFLVPVGDYIGFARAIEKQLSNPIIGDNLTIIHNHSEKNVLEILNEIIK
jgi:glycosyltransferase involved in cell wall biosynthesis